MVNQRATVWWATCQECPFLVKVGKDLGLEIVVKVLHDQAPLEFNYSAKYPRLF